MIKNLEQTYRLETKGLLACPHTVRATHKRPRHLKTDVLQTPHTHDSINKTIATNPIHNSQFTIHN